MPLINTIMKNKSLAASLFPRAALQAPAHSSLICKLSHAGALQGHTLVMNTLVMLSGLSPSGLGGPKSCSPSPFSKLYRKAGFRICCRTYKRLKMKEGENRVRLLICLKRWRGQYFCHPTPSSQNSTKAAIPPLDS